MNIDRECAELEPEAPVMASNHLPALDGLRGIAALMVVVIHTTTLDPANFAERTVHRFATLGWTGVDLFFVLSGFLITGILADARGGRHVVRNFYIRRLLRIWPLYLAFLTFCFVIEPLLIGSQTGTQLLGFNEKLAFWLHLGNVVFAHKGYLPDSSLNVTWSLAVEEHFYLIWPAIAILCNRRAAMRTAAAVFFSTFLLRWVLIGLGTSPMSIYVLTPCRMDALAAGSWVALAARGPGGLTALWPAAWRVFLASTMTLAVVLVFLLVNRRPWFWSDTAFQTGGYTLLAAAFAAGLVLLLTSRRRSLPVRFFEHPLPRTFGKYSYAIYLFHWPLCHVFWMLGFGPAMTPTILGSAIPAQMSFTCAITATTLGFAWLSWHLYEKPFLSLKRFFPATGTPPATPSRAVIPVGVEVAQRVAVLA